MKNLSKEEFVQTLRRASASLARGGSKYKNSYMKNDHSHLFQNRFNNYYRKFSFSLILIAYMIHTYDV